eukprot:gene11516-19957_t
MATEAMHGDLDFCVTGTSVNIPQNFIPVTEDPDSTGEPEDID